mmetsp:Transcript_22657/g.62898  ORF Transcript_22657/g.62898 Transcript_22657/m.62898 type:complete len:311 (+) Transcript_22657:25-957(+)
MGRAGQSRRGGGLLLLGDGPLDGQRRAGLAKAGLLCGVGPLQVLQRSDVAAKEVAQAGHAGPQQPSQGGQHRPRRRGADQLHMVEAQQEDRQPGRQLHLCAALQPVPEVAQQLESARERQAHQRLLEVRRADGGDRLQDVLAWPHAQHQDVGRQYLARLAVSDALGLVGGHLQGLHDFVCGREGLKSALARHARLAVTANALRRRPLLLRLEVSLKEALQPLLPLLLHKERLIGALPAPQALVVAARDDIVTVARHSTAPHLGMVGVELQKQLPLVGVPVLERPVLADREAIVCLVHKGQVHDRVVVCED